MANTIITSTTNAVSVEFNDDGLSSGITHGTWSKSLIRSITLKSDHVEIIINTSNIWSVSYTNGTTKFLKIDSVDGSVPSSNQELYDKLKVLIQ